MHLATKKDASRLSCDRAARLAARHWLADKNPSTHQAPFYKHLPEANAPLQLLLTRQVLHTTMSFARISKLPLLLAATLAFLTLTLPRIYTFAMHQAAVTPDNSVLLANALGLRENFDASIAQPICFIKIYSVQISPLVEGINYIYTVQGCATDDFSRRFGVCRNGECDLKAYQVQVLVPTNGEPATVEKIWTHDQYTATTSVV